MTPPKASEPYATEPGPRATWIPSRTNGSRYVALGPTRLSEVTRAPSIRMSVLPLARPRITGTAACPSETLLTPGTFSSACVRLTGWRTSISVRDRSVVAFPGAVSMSGAVPAVTVTDSSMRGDTRISKPDSGIDSTRYGVIYRSPGRTTRTSKGRVGLGVSVKRPSASVRADPVFPITVTSAFATGAPVSARSTRPSTAHRRVDGTRTKTAARRLRIPGV